MERFQSHFNLIVIGNDDLPIFHRASGEASFPADRLFEYTDEELKSHYDDEISTLAEMPALVVPELRGPNERQPAFLTRIGHVERRGRNVHFLFEHLFKWFPAEVVFNSGQFDIHLRGRGIDERFRTHWAVKKGNLVEGLMTLFEGQSLEGSSPELTGEQWTPLSPGPVFVLMPFGDGSSSVFETIQAACRNHQLETIRFDDVSTSRSTSDQVLTAIKQSRLVISDLTGSNPNVLYETGLAVGLGHDVIVIFQDQDDIQYHPVDHMAIRYLPTEAGLTRLEEDLGDAIRGRGGKWQTVHSLV